MIAWSILRGHVQVAPILLRLLVWPVLWDTQILQDPAKCAILLGLGVYNAHLPAWLASRPSSSPPQAASATIQLGSILLLITQHASPAT